MNTHLSKIVASELQTPSSKLQSIMPSFSIRELANTVSATIMGNDHAVITNVAPIMCAQMGDITFLTGNAYKRFLSTTSASAILLKPDDAKDCPETISVLTVDNPELAFARILRLFYPIQKPAVGIHPTAVIASTVKIDPSASIGAHVVIGERVVIGAGTVIGSGVSIGNEVTIGSDCWIYSRATLYDRVSIGSRVILHSGTIIGADGFGLAQDQGRWEKIPQIGSVVIGDDVEIGANSCVDRGALENTMIEQGVKIDNLVQIAHNVKVGAHTVLAGCSSIAGSTVIGKHCVIGGSVSISGHITICDGAILTGCAMATNSVKEPGVYSSGTGLFPNAQWRKVVAHLRRLKKSDQ